MLGLEEASAQFPLHPERSDEFPLVNSVGALYLGPTSPLSSLATPVEELKDLILQVLQYEVRASRFSNKYAIGSSFLCIFTLLILVATHTRGYCQIPVFAMM